MIIIMPMIIFSIILLFFISKLLLNMNNTLSQKSSTFECGFEPFSHNKAPFSLRFFKIIIIFLIFDIEIIIMLPIPLLNPLPPNFVLYTIIIIIITLGLYVETKQGALNWLN